MGCVGQRGDEGDQRDDAVLAAGFPGVLEGGRGNQAGHRQQDDDGQHGFGQVIEERGEEQQGDGDEQAVEDHGEAGLGAGLQVDGRTGKGAAGRVGLEESAAHIGQTLADEFLIGVNLVLGLGGHRLRHRDRFHEGHQRDDQGCGKQRQDGVEAERGQLESGQAGGNAANHVATAHQADAAFLDLLDMPLSAIGLDAGRHLTGQIEMGRFAFGGLGAQEAHLVQGLHAQLVFAFEVGDGQFHQFDLVIDFGDAGDIFGLAQCAQFGRLGGQDGREVANVVVGVDVADHQRLNRRVVDLIRLGLRLVLEADGVAHQRGDDDRYQHAGFRQRLDLLQTQHQRQRESRHGQRRQVGVREIGRHLPDILEEDIRAALGDAQQHVELRQRDDDRRSVHEAEDHRVGNEIDDGA